nr:MAG TPA: hypothetical protein [Caudoviricetes sp.]
MFAYLFIDFAASVFFHFILYANGNHILLWMI